MHLEGTIYPCITPKKEEGYHILLYNALQWLKSMGGEHSKITGWTQLVAIGKAPGVRHYFGNALTRKALPYTF